jgi:hypothetical protein
MYNYIMDNEGPTEEPCCGSYFILGIVTFLFVLSVKKYNCIDTLRESIENYISEISPHRETPDKGEIEKEDDILVLEELRDMVEDFVIRNPEIFSNLNYIDYE